MAQNEVGLVGYDPFADGSDLVGYDPYKDASPAPQVGPERTTAKEPEGFVPEGRVLSGINAATQGAVDIPAGVAKGVGISAFETRRGLNDAFDAVDAGEDLSTFQTSHKFAKTRELPPQSTLQMQIYARMEPEKRPEYRARFKPMEQPQEHAFYKAGEDLSQWAHSNFPENPEYEGDFWTSQVPRGAGSTAGFLATTGAALPLGGVPALAATAGVGAGVEKSAMFEDALNSGATLEQALDASDYGAWIGTTEAIPIAPFLSRLDRVTGGGAKRLIVDALKQGTEEAVQEASQSILENLVANNIIAYDPDRGTFAGTGENAGVGFTTGVLYEFLAGVITGRHSRSVSAPGPDIGETRYSGAPDQGTALPAPPQQEQLALPSPQETEGGRTSYGDGFTMTEEGEQLALPAPRPGDDVYGEGFVMEGQSPAPRPVKRTKGQQFRPSGTPTTVDLQNLMEDARTIDEIRAEDAQVEEVAAVQPENVSAVLSNEIQQIQSPAVPTVPIGEESAATPPAVEDATQPGAADIVSRETKQEQITQTEPDSYVRRKDGRVFTTEKSAMRAARNRPDIKGKPYTPVQADGGWALIETVAEQGEPVSAGKDASNEGEKINTPEMPSEQPEATKSETRADMSTDTSPADNAGVSDSGPKTALEMIAEILGENDLSENERKARALEREADGQAKDAHGMLEHIVPGQPVLSTADRNLRARSWEKMRKASDLRDQAETIRNAPPTETVTNVQGATEQSVIPGAEKISDKELAERKMEGPKKAVVAQKDAGSDGGLFDTGARDQTDMFDAPKTETSTSMAAQRGGLSDASIMSASEPELRQSLIEIANDFFRGLQPIHKTVARRALNGEPVAISEAREALKAHRDYWVERTKTEQQEEVEFTKRMDRMYGATSIPDLEGMVPGLNATIRSLQEAGRNEFGENGGRRTRAATSNEAARATGQERMDLERYIRDRKKRDTKPVVDQKTENVNDKGSEQFSIPNAEPDVLSSYTWKDSAERRDLAQRVKNIHKKIAPRADLETIGELFGDIPGKGRVRVYGSYGAARNLVKVALDYGNPEKSVNHEGVHALRTMDLFTKSEWDILSSKARREWIAKYEIERLYRQETKDQKIEEAIAQAYAEYATGGARFPLAIRRIFDKISRYLKAISRALKRVGIKSVSELFERVSDSDILQSARAETIFDRVEAGEVGRRDNAPGMTDTFAYSIEDTPPRSPWSAGFPSVQTHLEYEKFIKHPEYRAAKDGDALAAYRLVQDVLSADAVKEIRKAIAGRNPIVASVHAEEASGRNKIPLAYAEVLAEELDLEVDSDIIQTFKAQHSGAGAYHRMAFQPSFGGTVEKGRDYIILDDTVAMGGTIANLKGYIEEQGGNVILASTLASRGGDRKLDISLFPPTLAKLRRKHPQLEAWWRKEFGHGLDSLTEGEAGHLIAAPSFDEIRNRFAQARQAAGADGDTQADRGRSRKAPDSSGVDAAPDTETDNGSGNGAVSDSDIKYSLIDDYASIGAHLERNASSRISKAVAGLKFLADKGRYTFQDKYIWLKRAQESIAKARGDAQLDDRMDAYLAEELYHGRTGKRLDDFQRDVIEPLVQDIHDSGLTPADVDEYLYARHAPERNARIAEINPELPDGGSGMTNAEAKAILTRVEKGPKAEAYKRIAAQVDRIIKDTMRRRLSAGLIDEETAKQWGQTYKSYVPLRGFADEGLGPDSQSGADRPRSGRGFDIRGKESKQAFGRSSQADSPLTYTIMAAEESMIRSEKNRVGQTFLRLVEENPNKSLWEVSKVEYSPRINKRTGLVEYGPNPSYVLRDNVLAVKVDGKARHITIHHEGLANAMKNVGADTQNNLLRGLQAVNRWLAFINTSANPEFIISNAFRDIQTAAYNLSAEDMKGIEKATLLDVRKALVGAYGGIKGKRDTAWQKHFHAYANAGGKTEFFALDDITSKRKKLDALMEKHDPSNLRRVRHIFMQTEQLIQDVNAAVENAVRLSAFVNATKAGMSAARAASLAKNLTVNFNRKGEFGSTAGALYLFYNASLQGTVRMVHALKSRRVRRLVYGLIAASASMDIINSLLAPGGDDGEPDEWEKVSEWTKHHNLIVMNPIAAADSNLDPVLFKAPMPYGYNVFAVMGLKIGEVARGKKTPMEAAADLMVEALNSFNPVGGSDTILATIMPTLMKPAYESATNKNFAGIPIKPEQNPYAVPKPESQLYFSSVRPSTKWIAQKLNELTGGNEVRPGMLDVSPETLDHYIDFTIGGTGQFVGRMADLPAKLSSGDVNWNDVPIARKILGSTNQYYNRHRYREIRDAVRLVDAELKAYADDSAKVSEIKRDYMPELEMWSYIKRTEKAFSQLYKDRRAIEAESRLPEDKRKTLLDRIDKEIESIATDTIVEYNSRIKANKGQN